jgi:hypothetical protein
MTLIIELSDAEEQRFRQEAADAGLDELEYARKRLLGGIPQAKPRTGAEALAFWEHEGVLGLFSDRPDTPEFARELRSAAESRGGELR